MRNKILILFVILIGTNSQAFSQTINFYKLLGGSLNDEGDDVIEIAGTGYMVTGSTLSYGAGNRDVFLTKTDYYGNILWTKTYGGVQNETSSSIKQTSDGGFIICGSTTSFGQGVNDIYLVKTDASGNLQWSKTFGGLPSDQETGKYAQQTSDGGYIVFGAYTAGYLLIKTNSSGVTTWSKKIHNASFPGESVWSGAQTSDGGYIICGTAQVTYTPNNSDVYVIKTDANGTVQWSKQYGGPAQEGGLSINEITGGGYIIGGYTNGYGAGGGDLLLLKINSTGTILWAKAFGGNGNENQSGIKVIQTPDGGFAALSSTTSFGISNEREYLIKTDASGNLQWSKIYGETTPVHRAFGICVTATGGYVLVGSTGPNSLGFDDVLFIKTDNLGVSGCYSSSPTTITTAVTTSTYSPTTTSVNYLIQTSPTSIVNSPSFLSAIKCITCIADAGPDRTNYFYLCCKPINSSSVTIGTPTISGYTYSWAPSYALSCTTCAQPNASPTVTTTYTVTVSNAACGTNTDVVTVTTLNGLPCECGGGDAPDPGRLINPSTNSTSEPAHITLFPNPTQNTLYINSDVLVKNGLFNVFDISGKLVLSQEFHDLTPGKDAIINVSSLVRGIYSIEIKGDNSIFTDKIIIE